MLLLIQLAGWQVSTASALSALGIKELFRGNQSDKTYLQTRLLSANPAWLSEEWEILTPR